MEPEDLDRDEGDDELRDPRESDPFGPPDDPIEVFCLHCGNRFNTSAMEYRRDDPLNPYSHGFWCCPITGCDGKGFGCDFFPTDPNWKDPKGLLHLSQGDPNEPGSIVNGFFHDDGTPMSAEEFFRAEGPPDQDSEDDPSARDQT